MNLRADAKPDVEWRSTRLAGVPEELCPGVRQVRWLRLTRQGEVGFPEENTKTQFLVVKEENEQPTSWGWPASLKFSRRGQSCPKPSKLPPLLPLIPLSSAKHQNGPGVGCLFCSHGQQERWEKGNDQPVLSRTPVPSWKSPRPTVSIVHADKGHRQKRQIPSVALSVPDGTLCLDSLA